MGNPARVMKKIGINEFLSNQYVIKNKLAFITGTNKLVFRF